MPDIDTYVADQLAKSANMGFSCPEAELNILRRLVMRKGAAEEYALEVQPEDFTVPEYATILKIIRRLVRHHKQVDLVSIDAEAETVCPGTIKPETLVQVARQTDFTVASWQSIEGHIRIVRDLATRRRAIEALEGLVAGLRDPSRQVADTLAEIVQAADKADTSDVVWTPIGDVLLTTYGYIEQRQKGEIKAITTGIGNLDRLIGGFFAGEITVVAARPSVGKSAFGANIALAAAKDGHKVGVVSCEMSDTGMGQRLLSHGAMVDGMNLRKADVDDDAWGRLADAMTEMNELPIDFMFNQSTVEDVAQAARKKARRGELDILIVDYIQFMETHRKFNQENLRVGYISRVLKRLAQVANIPVIVLAQVNRMAEGRMPTKNDLKDSGNIEQDADGIIFLHRPDSAEDPCIDPRDKPYWHELTEKGLAYLALGVAKQRNGAIGQANVIFDPAYMRYAEIDRRTGGG